jgi:glycosyltransferase involved in cell wall biosynthesis
MYSVTLAIPVYNVEKHIERALNSALNQTFNSIEYLLIDDRGTDNSMNIARDIIKNHPRGEDVRIIEHEKNIGLGGTRNTAIENAQGKYIYFMDSDDEITPNCISILYEKMIEYPVDFVAASHNLISSDGKIKEQTVYDDFLTEKGELAVARAYYLKNKIVTTYVWNKLYDLDFLRRNNIKCIHQVNEDIFFTYQIVLKSQSCNLLSDITYCYYENDSSIMAKIRKSFTPTVAKRFEEIISLKKDYSRNYKAYDFYPHLIKRIFSRYALPFSVTIYNSKIIGYKEKKDCILNILAYPVSFKEMIAFRDKFHWIIFLINKIPDLYFKIFAIRVYFKIQYKLFK